MKNWTKRLPASGVGVKSAGSPLRGQEDSVEIKVHRLNGDPRAHRIEKHRWPSASDNIPVGLYVPFVGINQILWQKGECQRLTAGTQPCQEVSDSTHANHEISSGSRWILRQPHKGTILT